MVDPTGTTQGVGRALAEFVLDWARSQGFRAMQFNAVVETNTRAVGVVALGRVRGRRHRARGVRHPEQGDVGLCVMHRFL